MTGPPQRPLVGVGVVVFKEDPGGERVLLVRRAKPPAEGRWALPGGRQRLGETVRQAARREVLEEAGLEVEVVALLDVVDSITHAPDGRLAYHYTLVDFLAEWRAGQARAGGDAAEVAWAAPDELGAYVLWDETLRVIRLALERRGGR